ncbi:hypothetical protein BK809_0002740 [Diplodia seriata]|uniref:FAD dependent oxidoreductase domain-containing protein n=1 Tax=Diplodia seriata TaxID=420778 RepID=A0A1S8B2Y7_9PEZI|nr:hypothetical protein BK809_0002740 [Diplodia seriata]
MNPSLPVPSPGLSFWHRTTRAFPHLNENQHANVPRTTKFLIIGSGVSGLITAYKLIESGIPGSDILILEAREAISGASGRNAGHIRPGTYLPPTAPPPSPLSNSPPSHPQTPSAASPSTPPSTGPTKPARSSQTSAPCSKTSDTSSPPTPSPATSTARPPSTSTSRAPPPPTHPPATPPTAPLAATSRTSRTTATRRRRAPQPACLPPSPRTSGPRRPSTRPNCASGSCPRSSARARGCGRTARRWRSRDMTAQTTARGTVAAEHVVHCTNAWAAALLPELCGFVTPLLSQVQSFVPPASLAGGRGLAHTMALRYGGVDDGEHYFSVHQRQRGDGAVVVGGSGTSGEGDLSEEERAGMVTWDDGGWSRRKAENSEREFKAIAGGGEMRHGEGLEHAWTGLLGMTADAVPLIGEVEGREGQWICAGFNGHGECFLRWLLLRRDALLADFGVRAKGWRECSMRRAWSSLYSVSRGKRLACRNVIGIAGSGSASFRRSRRNGAVTKDATLESPIKFSLGGFEKFNYQSPGYISSIHVGSGALRPDVFVESLKSYLRPDNCFDYLCRKSEAYDVSRGIKLYQTVLIRSATKSVSSRPSYRAACANTATYTRVAPPTIFVVL